MCVEQALSIVPCRHSIPPRRARACPYLRHFSLKCLSLICFLSGELGLGHHGLAALYYFGERRKTCMPPVLANCSNIERQIEVSSGGSRIATYTA